LHRRDLPPGQRLFVPRRTGSSSSASSSSAATATPAIPEPGLAESGRVISMDEFGEGISRRTSAGSPTMNRSSSQGEQQFFGDRGGSASSTRPGSVPTLGSSPLAASQRNSSAGNFRGKIVSGGVVVGVERGGERATRLSPGDLFVDR
jgi:hypothetical protein